MAIKIEMPKLSDTMEEGVISKWNVNEGDEVLAGDIIAEVETDKATMDVEVFDAGTVLRIVPGEGDAVPLGGLIAIIGEADEDISSLLEESMFVAKGGLRTRVVIFLYKNRKKCTSMDHCTQEKTKK